MSPLDPVILLAADRPTDALSTDDHAAFFRMNLDLVAAETWHFRAKNKGVSRFVEIDGWTPPWRINADELTDLLLQGKQVAQRIPPCERHAAIVACWPTGGPRAIATGTTYARIREIYRTLTRTVMSSVQATRLRKGMLIKVGNDLFRILDLHHLTPGNKRAHIQCRMRNIRTLALADQKFRAEEDIQRATLDEREMQYLYNDGFHYYFMDTTTFEQFQISEEALGDSKDYLVADSVIRVEFYDVEPVGIELPQTVDLVVKETVPGIKGATASAQVKPATLETGLVVQVPPFVNEGDKIRVNTGTGEYQSRV